MDDFIKCVNIFCIHCVLTPERVFAVSLISFFHDTEIITLITFKSQSQRSLIPVHESKIKKFEKEQSKKAAT
ncbi:hypothetical protein WN51_14264 [Melipona quadrifasciata]|uniref:Uncharacterized protein n=1 Tax=Melipona quadrifasciata TaxID=166423 RepID=A0A0N0BGR4_9HYME|nr:hypothetical protein WN51_14264 [Melipona quadrifasciata]